VTKVKYAEIVHAQKRAECQFDDGLLDCDPASPIDWMHTGTDEYDNSVELHGVPNECRLSEKQQRYLFDAGFSQCWLNHCDGWETFYRFSDLGSFSESIGRRALKAGS
jgi:hypothetical protein